MIETIQLTDHIDACRALRRTVFIEEQGVSEADEIDDLDPVCLHLLATQDGQPIGIIVIAGFCHFRLLEM